MREPTSLPNRIVAPALRPGDAIGVIAPAGPVNRERLQRALGRVEARGFRIKTYGDLFAEHGYLAGDDARRLGELNAALADPETAAVMPARGGYGCARLLAGIDYDTVRRRPKIVTGFSDISALHAALQSQTGLATFHSANLIDGWGDPEPPTDWVEQAFWQMLKGETNAAVDEDVDSAGTLPPAGAESKRETLVAGVAEGMLIGGNAAVFTGLAGSPYLPDSRGAILFLEDVGEQPYRIDRMLAQLKLSGYLDEVAGVLLGQFTDCTAADEKPSLDLATVFADYLQPLGVPVLAGFPSGHVRDNLALPLGTRVQLDADRQTHAILEPPVAK
ncbi:MAG: LD-carboxypeptidase [Planctomycetales bacterium]|nr:LD-carboxypeptidase [Planctomycetales bacterium]